MFEEIQSQYNEAITDTNREQALQVVQTALNAGISPEDIVFHVVIPSIETFLSRAAAHQASLAQHYLTAQIANDVVDEMLPLFKVAPDPVGKMVIGTSLGDFHAMGKRIVIGCLKANMIDVLDLGLNVPAESFVDQALDFGARVIGISSLMIHTARGEQGCLGVRRILKERNLEDRIKIIVGGAPYKFDDELYRIVGADAWAEDGLAAAKIVLNLLGEAAPE